MRRRIRSWLTRRNTLSALRIQVCFCAALGLLAGEALFAFGVSASAPAKSQVVMVFGDSLSAAYGIETEQGWVRLLQTRFETLGMSHRVANASITGDTTRGGLARIRDALEDIAPSLVIIELGGNDGLRGLALAETSANLSAIIDAAVAYGAKVLLVGIRLPPNYGPAYTQRFESIFIDLATQFSIPLVPFLLEGVALDVSLMQEDGLHPGARAQPLLLDNVWPYLQPLID